MSYEEWFTLVGAVLAAIVSMFNARKLKVIHQDTNGNLGELKGQIAVLRERLAERLK